MKKIFLAAACLFAFFSAGSALAAQFGMGNNYSLGTNQTVNDNLYSFGGNISVAGKVNGDLIAAGGTVMVSGEVAKDAAIAGGNLTILGKVAEDLRAAGGSINVAGQVGGETFLAAGQITLAESFSSTKDLFVGAGTIEFNGTVQGNADLRGDEVVINGKIAGTARVYAQKLTIGPGAVLGNGLVYDSPNQAQIQQGATINGETVFNKVTVEQAEKKVKVFSWPASLAGWLVKMLMSLALGFVLFALFRKKINSLANSTLKDYGWNLLRGFALIILLPIAAVVMFITVIGVPIGFIFLLAWFLSMIIGGALAGIALGSLLYALFKITTGYETGWASVALGIVIFQLLGAIPAVGWVLRALLFLPAFGAIYKLSYERLRETRQA